MTHYNRIVRCPNCNKVTEHTNSTSKTLHGTPFRVCKHCGKTYFDSEYTEEAILRYQNIDTPSPIKSLLGFIIFSLVTYGVINSIPKNGFHIVFLILIIIFFLLAFVSLCSFILDILHIFHKEKYRQEQIRKVEELLNSKTLTGDTKASMERMSDVSYVRTLLSYGVGVPDFFLKRLGDAEYQELLAFKRSQKENIS